MLRRCFLLLACCWAGWAAAVEPALISVGDSWAFLPGTNEPPAQWREVACNDTDWRRGESGFGRTSRGEHTLFVGVPRGYGTMYFRRPFTVTNPADISALILRLDWQGGFVAYLNGTEVLRRMLGPPGSPLSVTNLSEVRLAGGAEDFSLPDFQSKLVPGTNVLAIEVHPSSPPRAYDIVLVPELLANFHRGPYIQPSGPEQMSVLWRTPLVGPARVDYGRTTELGGTVPAESHPAYAFATLTNLAAGTEYFYRVVVSLTNAEVASPIYRFRSLSAEGPLTAVMLGDTGSGAWSQFDVARELRRQADSADVVVHLGDIVYPWFNVWQTDTRCLSVYRDVLRSVPSFMMWGNHDVALGIVPFQSAFRMPTNDTPSMEHLQEKTQPDSYYSFDAGDAHFAVLYLPLYSVYVLQTNSVQYRWLEQDLSASDKRWKFICLHHPVNTSGLHRLDDYNTNGIHDRVEIQDTLLPLAERHGVRAIFSGHDHDYERFQPVRRVHTVVSGGGGVGLYYLLNLDTNSACFYLRWHLSRLEVRDDTLRLTALDTLGKPLDVLEFRDTPADSADADGDGLGDLAEELAGSDPTKPDTDGDGLPDGWEFLRGLDPRTPSVVRSADGVVGPGDPALLAEVIAAPIPRPMTELRAHWLPDGRVQLRWLGVVGKRIQLEAADGPTKAYVPLEGVPAKPLTEDRQAVELPAETAARFFRVRVLPEAP